MRLGKAGGILWHHGDLRAQAEGGVAGVEVAAVGVLDDGGGRRELLGRRPRRGRGRGGDGDGPDGCGGGSLSHGDGGQLSLRSHGLDSVGGMYNSLHACSGDSRHTDSNLTKEKSLSIEPS